MSMANGTRWSRILALFLCCACLLIVFSSCGKGEQPNETEESEQASSVEEKSIQEEIGIIGEYTIIRSDNTIASDMETKLSTELRKWIIEVTQKSDIKIKTDWIDNETDEEIAQAKEILIGLTNRPESAKALEKLEEEGTPFWYGIIGNKICIVGQDVYTLQDGVYSFMEQYFGYERENVSVYHNVQKYGAVGDGKTDNVKAFNNAIRDAQKDGYPVYIPLGTYALSSKIVLNGVSLVGQVKDGQVPSLLHTKADSALFSLISGAALLNLDVHSSYDKTKWNASSRTSDAPAFAEILLDQPGTQVRHVRIFGAYAGIQAGGLEQVNINPGRLYVSDVEVIEPCCFGIFVGGCRDSSWVTKCSVYGSEGTTLYGFWFGDNDELICSDLTAYGTQTGFRISCEAIKSGTEHGGYWGTLTACRSNGCEVGISVGIGGHKVAMTDCTFLGTRNAMLVDEQVGHEARVCAYSSVFASDTSHTIDIQGGMITLTGNEIYQTLTDKACAVKLEDGFLCAINGNRIWSKGLAISIEALSEDFACSVLENEIVVGGSDSVSNNLESDLRMFENNTVSKTETMPAKSATALSVKGNPSDKINLADVSDSFACHNVLSYGAKGDGVKDDSEAFMQAILDAKSDGLPVYVPYATYAIGQTLELDGVTLIGYDCVSWTSDGARMPVLHHTVEDTPCISMSNGATLYGIAINASMNMEHYNNSTKLSDTACAEIVAQGDCTISHIRINRPYVGIAAGSEDDSSFVDLLHMEEVFIIQAYRCGILINGSSEGSYIRDCEVWNNAEEYCGYGFWFKNNENLRADNLAVFKADNGFLVGGKASDSCNITLTNSGADLCTHGLHVMEGNHEISLKGTTFQCHFYGVNLESKTGPDTSVLVENCYFKVNGASPIVLAGGREAKIIGCNVVRVNSNGPAVSVSGSSNVEVLYNSILIKGFGVEVTNKAGQTCSVVGNLVYTSHTQGISTAGAKGTVRLASNASLVGQEVS